MVALRTGNVDDCALGKRGLVHAGCVSACFCCGTGAEQELVGAENAKRLSLVQSSASDIDFTAKAIANAGKVVIALGADENGPKSSIGAQQAYVLLKAAEQAKSPSFTLITDLSDSGSSDSADGGIFGAVFGFLSKMGKRGVSYAELVKEIVDSDVSYTIVRTGKPVPDSLAATSSIVITQEGQLASGTVRRERSSSRRHNAISCPAALCSAHCMLFRTREGSTLLQTGRDSLLHKWVWKRQQQSC